MPGAPAKPEPQPAKPRAEPAKPPRPVELSATFITAHVLRYDGTGKTELDQLDTEGAVRVVQEPSAEDNGFTIRGEKLALKTQGDRQPPEGSRGDLAELHMDRLVVVGPEIEVDQGDNTATVDGDGYMQMENTTDFQGNPLKKPEWLTVYWKKLMRFEGSFAEFHGDIEAQQAHSRLPARRCKSTSTSPSPSATSGGPRRRTAPRGEEPARAKKLLCDRSVKVEEEAYEVRYRLTDALAGCAARGQGARSGAGAARDPEGPGLRQQRPLRGRRRQAAGQGRAEKYQGQVVSHATYEPDPRRLTGFKSLDCLELMVMNLERTMTRRGAGRAAHRAARRRRPRRGPGRARPRAEGRRPSRAAKPPEEWTLTLVTYGRFGDGLGKNGASAGRMDADNNTHTATFYEDVQVLHIPWTSDPKKLREAVNVAATLEKLPSGGLYMECRKKLKVYSPEEEGPGKPPAGDERHRQARHDRHRPGVPQGDRRQGPALLGRRRGGPLRRGEGAGDIRRRTRTAWRRSTRSSAAARSRRRRSRETIIYSRKDWKGGGRRRHERRSGTH